MTGKKLRQVKSWVKKEAAKVKDPQHGWRHVKRVADNAKKIVESLGLESKVDINLLQAACFFHDINRVYYSPTLFNYFFETRHSKLVLPQVFRELGIKGNEREIIENAIYSSSFSFPFKKLNKNGNLYTQVLQDADTLDFFSKEREKSFMVYSDKCARC